MFTNKDFLKFSSSIEMLDFMLGLGKTPTARDIRGKHIWEPYNRYREEYMGEKSWSGYGGDIPRWLIEDTQIQDLLNGSDSRKIDAVGISPIGWSVNDHLDWNVRPHRPYRTFVTSEYAADNPETTLLMIKNKDDFLKVWGDPCIVDEFRVNTYNESISKEFITQYEHKEKQPDIRTYSTFMDNDLEWDSNLWKFIHARINGKAQNLDDFVMKFEARHPLQQEIVDKRIEVFKRRLVKGLRATFWDWITGGVGKTPMGAETAIQAIKNLSSYCDQPIKLILTGYHNRQVLTQNEQKKLAFFRGADIFMDTLCVTKATLKDPYSVPYKQAIHPQEIISRIQTAIDKGEEYLNIPYLYHHSTELDKALKALDIQPFYRDKDELDWPIGSLDSKFVPGYHIGYFNKPLIDFGSTATIVENNINGMNRVEIVGTEITSNRVTLWKAAKLGLIKQPKIYPAFFMMNSVVEMLDNAGISYPKKKVKGKLIPDLNAYVKSKSLSVKGQNKYLTLRELIELICIMDIVKDNPSYKNILATNTYHDNNRLFYENWRWLTTVLFNNHPGLVNISHEFFQDEDSNNLSKAVETHIKSTKRNLNWFVNRASRGFDVPALNTYLPFAMKNFRSMMQEWMRVLRLHPSSDIGTMLWVEVINDIVPDQKPTLENTFYKKCADLIKADVPIKEWIESGFKSKSPPKGKKPPSVFTATLPVGIDLTTLKSIVTSNREYRNTFEVSEYTEAHTWYRDEYMTLANPADSRQREDLNNRFAEKYQTLIDVTYTGNKVKTWIGSFAVGSHRFLKIYQDVQKNVSIMKQHLDNFKEDRTDRYDSVSIEIRKELDKEKYNLTYEQPKNHKEWKAFKVAMTKKYQLPVQKSNKVWGMLMQGTHEYMSQDIQMEHQHWYEQRKQKIVDHVITILEDLVSRKEMPTGPEIVKTYGRYAEITFAYYMDSKHKLPGFVTEDKRVENLVEQWKEHYKKLTNVPCNTPYIWQATKEWYENIAPWYIKSTVTMVPKGTEPRNSYIENRVFELCGRTTNEKEINFTLKPLTGRNMKKSRNINVDVSYEKEILEWATKRDKAIDLRIIDAKNRLDSGNIKITHLVNHLHMNRQTFFARCNQLGV